jgi:hypothetical protein
MSVYANSLEERNLRIYLLKHPFELFMFIIKGAVLSITKLLFKPYKSCSRGLRKMIKIFFGDARRAQEASFSLERFPELRISSYEKDVPRIFNIKLATREIPVDGVIDWSCRFEDQEDTFAINRFGWLLALLLQYPAQKTAEFAIENIVSWIYHARKSYEGPAWESYSVAERLANWPFILLIVKEIIPIPDDARRIIAESMSEQIEYLLDNLELNGRFTNNHILNDARGLYISGVVLNHVDALNKSRELFTAWTQKIFYGDGMLKDGSSHYQYLLCQRYEQVYHLSRHIKDELFLSFMQKWASSIRCCCDFFSVYGKDDAWRIPLFGDISPDFSPEWLAPRSKSGWALLKNWLDWRDIDIIAEKDVVNPNIKGNFIRFDRDDTIVFWHIAQERNVCLSHGHYDLGSFVLFRGGKEIFADPGLYSYDKRGSVAKSARAHNSILIDSFGPLCENYKLNLLSANLRKGSKFSINQSGGWLSIDIQSDGFERLPVPVEWRRRFDIGPDKMVITDNLKSCGNNLVESRFQISPKLKAEIDEEGVIINFNGNSKIKVRVMDPCGYDCSLIRGNDTIVGEGCFFPEYGRSLPGISILFNRKLYLNQNHVYEIRW